MSLTKLKVYTTIMNMDGYASLDDTSTKMIVFSFNNPKDPFGLCQSISAYYIPYASDRSVRFYFGVGKDPMPNYYNIPEDELFQKTISYDNSIPFELVLELQRIGNKIGQYRNNKIHNIRGKFHVQF